MTMTMTTATAHHRPGPCSIHWSLKPHAAHAEDIRDAVRRLIRCAVRRWPVPGGARKALAVARCESGLWPWADGGESEGVFQHLRWYWPARYALYTKPRWELGDSVFNARANVIVSIRMAHRGGWGPWSCA